MIVWVLLFTISWVQFALLNRNYLHAVSRKSYSYYNSSACISSGRATPFIQPVSQFPNTYTASYTGPGQINILFANCFSQQAFWYILSAWCFPSLPFQKRRYHFLLSLWWLPRLGPAVLLPGTEQLQAVHGIRRVQFASGSANGRLAAPRLPSSLKEQGSGLQIHTFSSDLLYYEQFC